MELLFVLHKKYEVEKLVAYKNLNSRKFTKTWGIWKTFERCNEIAADANVWNVFFKLYTLHIHNYTVYSELWCVSLLHNTLYMLLHFKLIYM